MSKNNDKLYYISDLDGKVHKLLDGQYQLKDDDLAYIGENTTEGFRVDNEVQLWTLEEANKLVNV
jgi:hypothetical protein